MPVPSSRMDRVIGLPLLRQGDVQALGLGGDGILGDIQGIEGGSLSWGVPPLRRFGAKTGPSGSAGGDKPCPYIIALEDILRRGRHPRAAALAPAGQFAFCPHRPAAAILHPRRRGGPCGRPSSPACPQRFPERAAGLRAGVGTRPYLPTWGAPHVQGPARTRRSGSRGERRPSGGSERSGLPGSE